jgi:hypothetical protein
MTTFDQIQDVWNRQGGPQMTPPSPEEIIQLARKNTAEIRGKHRWTMGILGVSILLFCWYIIAYTGWGVSRFHAGLSLMLFSLLLRLILESVSYVHFRRIDIGDDFQHYTRGITRFYNNRKKIHYFGTPVMLGAYVIGFVLLLPVFKKSFSTGFFWYILISGSVFFIVFCWFMIRQVKKEMGLLGFLKQVRSAG